MWTHGPRAAGRAELHPTSWRWRLLVGVVAALLVVTGAVSVASASSSGGGRDWGRTLQFRTTVVSSSINDAGHGGVADVTAVLFSMQRPDGTTAGQGWISCVNILATDQLCHAAFVLANGQIQAQAEIPMAATTFTADDRQQRTPPVGGAAQTATTVIHPTLPMVAGCAGRR